LANPLEPARHDKFPEAKIRQGCIKLSILFLRGTSGERIEGVPIRDTPSLPSPPLPLCVGKRGERGRTHYEVTGRKARTKSGGILSSIGVREGEIKELDVVLKSTEIR